MTLFDLVVLGVIVISGLEGLSRGAVHELIGLFAFTLSAIATVAFLPATTPLVRHILHVGFLATAVAALISFVIVFVFLKILAATLTASLNTVGVLGGANRAGGLVFGALRGVLLLAVFALIFNRATPQEWKPGWITGSMTYPIASAAGRGLLKVLPKGLNAASILRPSLSDAMKTGDSGGSETQTESYAPTDQAPLGETPSSERAKRADHGYTRRARDSVDALVERSK